MQRVTFRRVRLRAWPKTVEKQADPRSAGTAYKQDDLETQETRSEWPSLGLRPQFISSSVQVWLQVSTYSGYGFCLPVNKHKYAQRDKETQRQTASDQLYY